MTHETLLPPRVAPEVVRSLNRLYGGARSIPFFSGGREWRFAPDGAARPAVWRARIYVRLGDHDLAVFLDGLAPADWEGSGLSLPTLSAMPPELAGAALELVCRDAAETLEAACGLGVAVSGLNMDEEEAWLPDEGFAFVLTRDDGWTTRGAVAASAACLACLADVFDARAEAASGVAAAEFFIRCRVLLSGPEVSVSELRGLEAGDILLTERVARDKEKGLPVRLAASPACGAPARLDGAALYMEGAMTMENPDVRFQDDVESRDGAAVPTPETALLGAISPDDLPVALAFDLGGVEITASQAAALAPGQVLTTGRDVSAPVRVTAAGRVVGVGSLVDVAGRIGVRIEALTLK